MTLFYGFCLFISHKGRKVFRKGRKEIVLYRALLSTKKPENLSVFGLRAAFQQNEMWLSLFLRA